MWAWQALTFLQTVREKPLFYLQPKLQPVAVKPVQPCQCLVPQQLNTQVQTLLVPPPSTDVQRSINPTICLNTRTISKNKITQSRVVSPVPAQGASLAYENSPFHSGRNIFDFKREVQAQISGTPVPALAASCFDFLFPPQSRGTLFSFSAWKYTYVHFVSIFE